MTGPDDTTERLAVDLQDDRYHRQTLISWWEQERLRRARVLVVGAGALGNELVKNLALTGIGTVVVIDLDEVENSNLSRCVFFRREDEGRPKAEVVCSRARELNDEIRFIPVIGDVRHAFGLGDLCDFDVVLGGLDNREARLHVNQACWKAGVPWIDGAIEGLMGTMRVFVPPESACYECTMTARDHQILAARRACSLLSREEMLAGKVPTTGTSGSVIAALQVQELVKLLHADQLPYSFAGQGFAFNGMTHDSYTVTYGRHGECPSHDTYEGLAEARRWTRATPMQELLDCGRTLLDDPDAALRLEHDIVLSAHCAACGSAETINRPAVKLTAADAPCPDCREERRLDLRHLLETPEQLALTAEDLALPGNDVVVVEGAEDRVVFLVGEPTFGLRYEEAAR